MKKQLAKICGNCQFFAESYPKSEGTCCVQLPPQLEHVVDEFCSMDDRSAKVSYTCIFWQPREETKR